MAIKLIANVKCDKCGNQTQTEAELSVELDDNYSGNQFVQTSLSATCPCGHRMSERID